MNNYRINDLKNIIDAQKSAIDTLKLELEVIKNQNRDFSNELTNCHERILHLENRNRLQGDRQFSRVTTNPQRTASDFFLRMAQNISRGLKILFTE